MTARYLPDGVKRLREEQGGQALGGRREAERQAIHYHRSCVARKERRGRDEPRAQSVTANARKNAKKRRRGARAGRWGVCRKLTLWGGGRERHRETGL